MALDHDTMITPPIEDLLDKVDSKFSLVTLAARRARHINSYFNQLGEGLGHMIPPQVSSTSRKPLSIAFEEIADSKIVWTEAPEELELEHDAEAEAQAMADAAEADAES
jgi:DNA-directed RNA polymerase subunit omega